MRMVWKHAKRYGQKALDMDADHQPRLDNRALMADPCRVCGLSIEKRPQSEDQPGEKPGD